MHTSEAAGGERLRAGGITWALIERWLVALVAGHSLAVGIMLLFIPTWATDFGGWEQVTPLFFVRQAGAFHFVVAFGYLLEYLRNGGITLMVFTKVLAVVFLLACALTGEAAWSVMFSGVADGLMAVAVLLVHRRVHRR